MQLHHFFFLAKHEKFLRETLYEKTKGEKQQITTVTKFTPLVLLLPSTSLIHNTDTIHMHTHTHTHTHTYTHAHTHAHTYTNAATIVFADSKSSITISAHQENHTCFLQP